MEFNLFSGPGEFMEIDSRFWKIHKKSWKSKGILSQTALFLSYIQHFNTSTVEPQLSEPHGRHTIRPDNRGVRIDEGNRNSRSMGYRVGDN